MKILSLMPTQKVMQIEAVQSLVAMQADIYNRGDNFNIAFTNGHNPVLSRTELMRYAAKQDDVDYVLWLDSDHIYNSESLYKLIEIMNREKIEAISAAYKVRGPGEVFAHGNFQKDGSFKKLSQNECSGITDCDVVGFGFYVMTHGLVKEMVSKYQKDLFNMDYNNNTTEDVYFCRKMKESNKRVCFDAETIVGHISLTIKK